MADSPVPVVIDWLEKSEEIEDASEYSPLLFLSASIISQAIEDLLAPPFVEENRQSRKMFKFLYLERERERYDALGFLRTCLRRRNPYIVFLLGRYPDSEVPFLIKGAIEKWRWNDWKEFVKLENKKWLTR